MYSVDYWVNGELTKGQYVVSRLLCLPLLALDIIRFVCAPLLSFLSVGIFPANWNGLLTRGVFKRFVAQQSWDDDHSKYQEQIQAFLSSGTHDDTYCIYLNGNMGSSRQARDATTVYQGAKQWHFDYWQNPYELQRGARPKNIYRAMFWGILGVSVLAGTILGAGMIPGQFLTAFWVVGILLSVSLMLRGLMRGSRMAITQNDMVKNAIAQVTFLVDKGVQPENIKLYGFSIGGAVASQVVAYLQAKDPIKYAALTLCVDSAPGSITSVVIDGLQPSRKEGRVKRFFAYIGSGLLMLLSPVIKGLLWLIGWEVPGAASFDRVRGAKSVVENKDDPVVHNSASIAHVTKKKSHWFQRFVIIFLGMGLCGLFTLGLTDGLSMMHALPSMGIDFNDLLSDSFMIGACIGILLLGISFYWHVHQTSSLGKDGYFESRGVQHMPSHVRYYEFLRGDCVVEGGDDVGYYQQQSSGGYVGGPSF